MKQVIVIRKDLKMRRGKEIAQGAHASIAFLTNKFRNSEFVVLSKVEKEWIFGIFKKICVIVNSEEELLEIHRKAEEAGLVSNLIQDSGMTEFHGEPTNTCLAIGPDDEQKIDKITGHLDLY
jgi:PTH2 family peptidyl-tRNA hydrolase